MPMPARTFPATDTEAVNFDKLAFDAASDFLIDQFGLPVRNVVRGLSSDRFFIPGSLIRMDVDAGHPLAMAMLGQAYQKGEGVVQDEKVAAEWYTKGGDAGEAACWAQLGDCYENGIGVKQDIAVALELYERAAEAGFLDVE